MAAPTEFEWSYLAGILDGEGNIFLQIKSDRAKTCALNIRVRIANTDKDLMDWIQEKFGGNLTISKGRTFHHKIVYQIAWYKQAEVLRILEGVLPYLIVKSWVAKNVVGLLLLPKDLPLEKLRLAEFIKEAQYHG